MVLFRGGFPADVMWFNEKYIMPRETPQRPAAQTLTVFIIKQSCHSFTMTVSLQMPYYDISWHDILIQGLNLFLE